MHFSAKKLFLIGFIFLLLVGIPATIYLVQQQQETQSHASPATTLSFNPPSSQGSPKTVNKGDQVPLDIYIDPGTNVVTLVTVELDYDADKLEVVPNSFKVNTDVFPTTNAGPIYSAGKIIVTVSAGANATQAVQVKQRLGTVQFKAKATTDPDAPTRVTFSSVNTLITSLGAGDQARENVFNNGGSSPAYIAIVDASASPTDEPTDEPTAAPTDEPTAAPTTEAPTPGTNPVCSSLSADTTSGQVPLAVNFTAAGTSVDPNTVSKVTFNFGDGQVSDVTTGGGIGTGSVNVQLSHSYSAAGTYQATAILTDSTNGVSDTTNCSQSISVAGAATTAPAQATATPTLPPTGSIGTTLGIAAIAGFMMIGGALLFFML